MKRLVQVQRSTVPGQRQSPLPKKASNESWRNLKQDRTRCLPKQSLGRLLIDSKRTHQVSLKASYYRIIPLNKLRQLAFYALNDGRNLR
ncbi:hypothetical protein AQ860_11330 [Burkholderia pseudomallei]|nr:hypothetical protein AQ760_17545 [Burkholderia pseudomallei]OMZ16420.1 hypothetical protein AQ859_13075 [Burkholderia pseudomallei]OMZ37308.1 hypothetical protein AQ860_11330 [Burkholderia pseudomallei]